MNRTGKAWLMAACVVAGMAGAPLLATAAVGVDIEIAPPAPRVEEVPPPRAGFVWAPGYWEYRGGAHVWVPGRWIGERRGFHWVPERWEARGPRWHLVPGHWER